MMLKQHMLEVDGATLQVFVGGEEGPLVCTSHPFGTYSEQRAGEAPPAPLRLVQVNPRGSGQSSAGRTAQDYSLDRFIDDLDAVRQQLGSESWVFMGYSGGGYAGLHYALRYPDALRGMVIGFNSAGPSFLNDPRSVLSPAHPAYRETLANSTRPAAADAFTGWACLDDLWLWYQHDQPTWVNGGEPDDRVRSFVPDMLAHPFDDRLADIRVPTLIFAGRDDPALPWQHVEALHGIPDSEFMLLECGHVDMSEGRGLEEYQVVLHHFLTDRLPAE